MLVENQKLLALVIDGREAPLYTEKYIPICISPYLGQTHRVVDNKCIEILLNIEKQLLLDLE